MYGAIVEANDALTAYVSVVVNVVRAAAVEILVSEVFEIVDELLNVMLADMLQQAVVKKLSRRFWLVERLICS